MKKLLVIFAALLISTVSNNAKAQTDISISFNSFHDHLSPYGRWVDYPGYGQVWVNNRPHYRPYYDDGHWVYTDYGWTWVSDQDWGWAPFHYGRWAFTNNYGWVWIPGYEWAPAWVSWSSGGDYYGWAPLGPGMELNSYYDQIPSDRWVFVNRRYINHPAVHNYYIDNSRNVTIIKNTTVINNIQVNNNVSYHAGPPRAEVERVTNTRIQPVAVKPAAAPGKPVLANQSLNIYKPQVTKENTRQTPATLNNKVQTPTPVTTQPVQAPKSIQPVQEQKSAVQEQQIQKQLETQKQETKQAQLQKNVQEQKQIQSQQQTELKQQQRQQQVQQQKQQQQIQQKQQIQQRQQSRPQDQRQVIQQRPPQQTQRQPLPPKQPVQRQAPPQRPPQQLQKEVPQNPKKDGEK